LIVCPYTFECLPNAQARVTVQSDALTGRAWVYDDAAGRDRQQRRTTHGTVLLDSGEHTLSFLLSSLATCLFHQDLLTAHDLPSGEIFFLPQGREPCS
jgi:hypothetical protein